MKPIVEINTEYIDANGVQHIDGYTSKAEDAEGTVVAYFINGEAYYTNPEYRFDELVKATVDGLKEDLNKTIKKKYEEVTETLTILKINENAICDEILKLMGESIAFVDADETLGEELYYGNVFQSIMDAHKNEEYEIPTKYLGHLEEMIELAYNFQYVLVSKI